MKSRYPELQFIEFVDTTIKQKFIADNKEEVSTKALALESKWDAYRVRTDADMVRYAMELVEYGNRHFSSCRRLIHSINEGRKKQEERRKKGKATDRTFDQVLFICHDRSSGFDSEAWDNRGHICANFCKPTGWLDGTGKLWEVPALVMIYHELGHYLQYVTRPEWYEAQSKLESANHHPLDYENVPQNEHPICREIGMGVRQRYEDMHELDHEDFKGMTVHYASLPRNRYFKFAVEPAEAREGREKEKALRTGAPVAVGKLPGGGAKFSKGSLAAKPKIVFTPPPLPPKPGGPNQ